MLKTSSFFIVALGLLSTVCAQDIDPPKSIIGFFKSGMHLGIRSPDENGTVAVTVYSDSEFAIASDSHVLKLDQLASKYPFVARARDAKLTELVASLNYERLSDRDKYDPWIGLITDNDELLCTVTYVGDDYILVEYGQGETRRRVFASRHVSTIHWGLDLNFKTVVGIVPK